MGLSHRVQSLSLVLARFLSLLLLYHALDVPRGTPTAAVTRQWHSNGIAQDKEEEHAGDRRVLCAYREALFGDLVVRTRKAA